MSSLVQQVGAYLVIGAIGFGLVWAGLCWIWGQVVSQERAAARVGEEWLRCRREGRPFIYTRRGQWPLGLAVVVFEIGLVMGAAGYFIGHGFQLGQAVLIGVLFLVSLLMLVSYPPYPRTTVAVRGGELTLRLIAAKRAPVLAVAHVGVRRGEGEGFHIAELEVVAPEVWGLGPEYVAGFFLLRPVRVVAAELDTIVALELGRAPGPRAW